MKHSIMIGVGPRAFCIGSDWLRPVEALAGLYAVYPAPADIPHFTVRLEAERWYRRFLRPSVSIRGDYMLPEALPVSLAHGLIPLAIQG